MKIKSEYLPVMLFILFYAVFTIININLHATITDDIYTTLATLPQEKMFNSLMISLGLTFVAISLISLTRVKGLTLIKNRKIAIAILLVSIVFTSLFWTIAPPFSMFPNGQAQKIGGWRLKLSETGAEVSITRFAKDVARLGGWEYIGYDDAYIEYNGVKEVYKNGEKVLSYEFEAHCDGETKKAWIYHSAESPYLTVDGGTQIEKMFYCDKPILLKRVGIITEKGNPELKYFQFDIYVQSCRKGDTNLCRTAFLKDKGIDEPRCSEGETREVKCQYSGDIITTHICEDGEWKSTTEKCPEGISGNIDMDDENWGSQDEGDHVGDNEDTDPPNLPPEEQEGFEPPYPGQEQECGANAYLGSDNLCYCNSGYMFVDNQCTEAPNLQEETSDWLIMAIVGIGALFVLGIAVVLGAIFILKILNKRG